jgi:hypothetical protein
MTRQFISHVEEIWQVITALTFFKNHVTELAAYHKLSQSDIWYLALTRYPVSGFRISQISGWPDIRQKQYPVHPYLIHFYKRYFHYASASAAPVEISADRILRSRYGGDSEKTSSGLQNWRPHSTQAYGGNR